MHNINRHTHTLTLTQFPLVLERVVCRNWKLVEEEGNESTVAAERELIRGERESGHLQLSRKTVRQQAMVCGKNGAATQPRSKQAAGNCLRAPVFNFICTRERGLNWGLWWPIFTLYPRRTHRRNVMAGGGGEGWILCWRVPGYIDLQFMAVSFFINLLWKVHPKLLNVLAVVIERMDWVWRGLNSVVIKFKEIYLWTKRL